MERKLGQTTERIVKQNNSIIKLTWDLVYDIPLLSSLRQLLSDEHILNEVSIVIYVQMCIVFITQSCTCKMHLFRFCVVTPDKIT